jgi:hypothetical protein
MIIRQFIFIIWCRLFDGELIELVEILSAECGHVESKCWVPVTSQTGHNMQSSYMENQFSLKTSCKLYVIFPYTTMNISSFSSYQRYLFCQSLSLIFNLAEGHSLVTAVSLHQLYGSGETKIEGRHSLGNLTVSINFNSVQTFLLYVCI